MYLKLNLIPFVTHRWIKFTQLYWKLCGPMIKSEHLWICAKSIHLHIPISLIFPSVPWNDILCALDETNFSLFFVRFSGSVPSDRIVASSMSTFPPLALKLVVHSEARRLPVEVANQALMPGSSICGGRLAQSITPRSCRWLRVSSLSNISRKKRLCFRRC
jgi:hypothetical protein